MPQSSDLKGGVIVISDRVYRGEARDESGELCRSMLAEGGFDVVYYAVVPNSAELIEGAIGACLRESRVCVTIGGTGPSPKDITIEVALRISTKTFPGFGEIFRRETLEKEGVVKAIATRAELFSVNDRLLLCLPGSPSAVRLGVSLFLRAAGHILEELTRADRQHRGPGPH